MKGANLIMDTTDKKYRVVKEGEIPEDRKYFYTDDPDEAIRLSKLDQAIYDVEMRKYQLRHSRFLDLFL